MKRILISLLILCQAAIAQTVSKQVIGAAGKTQSTGNAKLSWTVGEPVVGLMTAGGNQLGNGYHPAMDLQALSIESNDLDLQIKVYPNPTSQMLYVSHPKQNTFSVQIVDLNGKLLYGGSITKEQPLDVSNYSQGIYLITVEDKETNKKNIYKIIKK